MSVTVDNLKQGDQLTLFNYYKVDRVEGDFVIVEDKHGSKISIHKEIVGESMHCTSQFGKEIKTTRSAIAAKMKTLGHAAFRVTFDKQVTAVMVSDGLEGRDTSTPSKRRKVVAELMKGERRVMHARLHRSSEDDPEMEFGRFKVIDLELEQKKEYAIRLVDTRTVSELIVEGVRYYI